MEGCKYCNNLSITDGDSFNDELASGAIKILGSDVFLSIDISKKHLCLNGFNYDDIISGEINYCPMCGKKL